MELKELSTKVLEEFGVRTVDKLGDALMECVLSNDVKKLSAFELLVEDLTVDWLQKIYQYYQADRKGNKQDYTPKSVAEFVTRLCGTSDVTIDMCAGSGALTIQRWSECKEGAFVLHEIDKNVIPYLLFNMALRNIECTVYNDDVLQQEIIKTYFVKKGERYGKVEEMLI